MHKLMYGFYCFMAAMMVVNMAVTILNVYLTDVKKLTQAAGSSAHNADLGQFMWSKLQALFSSCGIRHQPLEETTVPVPTSGKYRTWGGSGF